MRAREAKKYELKNEQTPLLSPHLLSLSVFVSRNFPQHTRKRGAKQKKSRRRRRRRRERAREEGEGGGAKTAVFFRALRVFGLSSGVLVCFVPRSSWEPPGTKMKKLASKENFCDHRFKTKRRPKERKTKGEEFFSKFLSLFLFPFPPSTRILPPASLSLLPRVNPVGYRWIPLYKFCSTRSARKRSKGNFGSRSLLRGYEESAGGRG